MMILNYESKKALKATIGQPLDYQETCTRWGFPAEYRPNGDFMGSNRPSIVEDFHSLIKRRGGVGKRGREFFATVTMLDGLINKVS